MRGAKGVVRGSCVGADVAARVLVLLDCLRRSKPPICAATGRGTAAGGGRGGESCTITEGEAVARARLAAWRERVMRVLPRWARGVDPRAWPHVLRAVLSPVKRNEGRLSGYS